VGQARKYSGLFVIEVVLFDPNSPARVSLNLTVAFRGTDVWLMVGCAMFDGLDAAVDFVLQ
jgi:hypothetical protein